MRLLRLLAFVPVLAACGGTSVQTIETTQFNPSLQVNLAASTKTPQGEYFRDLVVGTGPVIAAGQLVQAHYVGSFPDGTKFDANTGSQTPFQFHFGVNPPEVIAGWDQGLVGAKVGSTRQLIIPPALGYGDCPQYQCGIPPNSILVFTVDIVSAQ